MENKLPEIEVRFWPFALKARGKPAIAAIRLPLAAILLAIAIAILTAVFLQEYWVHAPIFEI